ncbi:hypothetical protein [Aquimarina aquimarini]|uniref:hypothetical protein n=1 Tax=Aquimarina aquimarini TaxID=1191734 RepID=UPI000D554A29|nr:hypothetical protein [Aquimarina aquimarini]
MKKHITGGVLLLFTCTYSKSNTSENSIYSGNIDPFQEEVIDRLNQIVLGFECSDAIPIIRKWKPNMKIVIIGVPTIFLLRELDKIVIEINDWTTIVQYSEIDTELMRLLYHYWIRYVKCYQSIEANIMN